MGNFDEAKKFNGWISCTQLIRCRSYCYNLALLTEKEPNNLQAQSLASLIDKAVTRGTRYFPVVQVQPC
jgi:hypothetical protein